jgi:hypothetical protein
VYKTPASEAAGLIVGPMPFSLFSKLVSDGMRLPTKHLVSAIHFSFYGLCIRLLQKIINCSADMKADLLEFIKVAVTKFNI